jgi:fructosamine-3-kinase
VSVTRPHLTVEQLGTIASVACPDDELVSSTELAGGTYNAVHRLDLASGRSVVVKVAPSPEAPRLRYELDLLRTEALFYERAAHETAVPLPEVVHAGFDRTTIESDFLVLSLVGGTQWLDAGELDDDVRPRLRRGLGEHVAELHTMQAERFGYPQQSTGALTAAWSDAFAGMIGAVLDDAAAHAVELPVSAADLRDLVARHGDTLDEVETPTFVHFDLWDGNLFIDPEQAEVTGIIDAERAFYGDPIADFVSLPLFGDPEADTDLLDGYREAGGPVEFTRSTRSRLALYRIYMDLLMLVEAAPRGHDIDRGMRTFFEQHLLDQLVAL